VGYRMLPLLQSDYRIVRAAQRVRGAKEGRGPLCSLGRFRRNVLPLLAGSVRRAGRVAIAMDARAFGAFSDRTYRETMSVNRGDWLFLAAVVLVLAVLLAGLWLLGIARFAIA
jgi:energy-coupling factor transport system permease protein